MRTFASCIVIAKHFQRLAELKAEKPSKSIGNTNNNAVPVLNKAKS